MRISYWSADLCSSDLPTASEAALEGFREAIEAATSRQSLLDNLAEAQKRFNRIIVSDTGSGMSRDDLERNFLVIGTASRKREVEAALKRGDAQTPYLGEKGIGRLSAMRLGERLRVETARADETHLRSEEHTSELQSLMRISY